MQKSFATGSSAKFLYSYIPQIPCVSGKLVVSKLRCYYTEMPFSWNLLSGLHSRAYYIVLIYEIEDKHKQFLTLLMCQIDIFFNCCFLVAASHYVGDDCVTYYANTLEKKIPFLHLETANHQIIKKRVTGE